MRNTFALYLSYLGISVRSQMQYRAAFIMQSIGHLGATGMEFAAILVLFDRFGSLRGWSLEEVALFYGLVNVAFAIADAMSRGFDLFGGMVKSGDFDRLLLRPRSTALQLAGQELTLKRIGRLFQGLAILLWAAWALDLTWTLTRLGLAAAAVSGSVALFIGIIVLQATLAFWTTESLEIVNTVTYGGVQTVQFPLSIYRPWFRKFFIYVIPLAFANYFPVIGILGKADPLGYPDFLQWCAPLACFAFLAGALRIWRFGEGHYTSTGS